MKTKLFAGALAALALMSAGAASAQDFLRDGDRRGDLRWRQEITVRDHGRVFRIDRNDRLFFRVIESPYRFRPGLTYVYTDNCRRDGQCRVLVYAPDRRAPVHSLMAPRINARGWGDNDGRGGRDGRWDDDDNRGPRRNN